MALNRKLRADSFSAGLTAEQRDELFAILAGGQDLRKGALLVQEWTGKRISAQAVSNWLARETLDRRFAVCKDAALVAQANTLGTLDAQARSSLAQAKFLSLLKELTPQELVGYERNDLVRQKLDLDKQRLILDQEKFARLILDKLEDLRSIATQMELSDTERLERVRQRLFGAPEHTPSLKDMDKRKEGLA